MGELQTVWFSLRNVLVNLPGLRALLVWLFRAALLIWINYFAVGCAVAVRRGIDDLVRSRTKAG